MPRAALSLLLAVFLWPAVPPAGGDPLTPLAPLTDETVLAVTPDPDYFFTAPAVVGHGGGFLVAWTSRFARESGSSLTDWGGGVEARLVAADGRPEGEKGSLVPEAHRVDVSAPALAADASGRYGVVWSSSPEGHPQVTHQLRLFSAAGATVSTTRLDRYAPPNFAAIQEEPSALAFGPAGRAFAVWPRPQPSRVESLGMFGELVSAAGEPLVPRFQVTARNAAQRYPQLGADRRGNAVLVYLNLGPNGKPALFLRLYDKTGQARSADVRITPPEQLAVNPALSVHADGRFVVAWQDGYRIRAQLFAPPHRPVGPAFEVHDGSTPAFSPSVALGDDGTVFVAWRGHDFDVNQSQVWARAYGPSGIALGEEFRVDREREPNGDFGLGTRPAVAAGEGGTFLVTWQRAEASLLEFLGSAIVSRLYGVAEGEPALP